MSATLVTVLVLAAVLVATAPGEPDGRLRRVLTGSRGESTVAVVVRRLRPGRARGGRRATGDDDVALLLHLVAAALTAGAPPVLALEVASRAMGADGPGAASPGRPTPSPADHALRLCASVRLGASWAAAWQEADPVLEPLRAPLTLVDGAGAPGAALLVDAARELRRRRAREAQRRAQVLGVRLVLPLGLCALPSFVALAVVPVVLGLAGQVVR